MVCFHLFIILLFFCGFFYFVVSLVKLFEAFFIVSFPYMSGFKLIILGTPLFLFFSLLPLFCEVVV